MPVLDYTIEKVARAKEHLTELYAELAKLTAGDLVEVSIEDHPQIARQLVRIKPKALPLRFSILAGDICYALRSGLDQLAWQLSLTTIDAPYDRCEFPVVWSSTDIAQNEARIANVLQNVPPAARDEIKALQPYLRGQDYKLDPLWQIDKLCNLDKHRIVITGFILRGITVYECPDDIDPVERRYFRDDGEIIEVVSPLARAADVQLDKETPIRVQLGTERDGIALGHHRTSGPLQLRPR